MQCGCTAGSVAELVAVCSVAVLLAVYQSNLYLIVLRNVLFNYYNNIIYFVTPFFIFQFICILLVFKA